jgi:hypothetical protein
MLKNKYVLFISLIIVFTFMWLGLEYTLDGQVIPLYTDSIILILLSYLSTDKVYDKLK